MRCAIEPSVGKGMNAAVEYWLPRRLVDDFAAELDLDQREIAFALVPSAVGRHEFADDADEPRVGVHDGNQTADGPMVSALFRRHFAGDQAVHAGQRNEMADDALLLGLSALLSREKVGRVRCRVEVHGFPSRRGSAGGSARPIARRPRGRRRHSPAIVGENSKYCLRVRAAATAITRRRESRGRRRPVARTA